MQKSAAQDISYASSVGSRPAQTFVRMVENVTGRRKLIKRAIGYEQDIAAGADFWTVMARRYGLSLEINRGAMGNIPAAGPLILLSNHPFGILDGLMLGYLLSQTRPEFRILANRVFSNAEDINKVILPISFDQTSAAVALNLQTRKDALAYLGQGGAIGVFPGGTVSTASRPFGLPADPGWRTFTAKMIARSEASVVPVFFEGHNSRLFQICSHLHPTLRTALFVKEFERRNDTPVRVAIGDPIPRAGLERHARDPKGLMDFLRSETYKLSASPQAYGGYGFEFESRYRQNRAPVS